MADSDTRTPLQKALAQAEVALAGTNLENRSTALYVLSTEVRTLLARTPAANAGTDDDPGAQALADLRTIVQAIPEELHGETISYAADRLYTFIDHQANGI
jgi:ornithine carbamoyltransferase